MERLWLAMLVIAVAWTFAPDRAAAAQPPTSVESVVAHVPAGARVTLYGRPGGAPITTVGDGTEFGSAMTFGVVRRSGSWLGVVSSRLGNDRVVWIHHDAVRVTNVPVVVTIDLSARSLVVHRNHRIVERSTVGIGRASSPTPVGLFAVTDKLPGRQYGKYYGCCILALSGHQPHLPRGWQGGDRIAIHGTDVPASIGAAATAGCLRAADSDLRILMRTVPLGTTVIIRP